MLLLLLIDFVLFALAVGEPAYEGAYFFALVVILPLAGLLGVAGLTVFAISWINRREDPRHARRPSDAP
jgi:hypothetical protein